MMHEESRQIDESHKSEWQDKEFVIKYARESVDKQTAWYEHEVNFPSLLSLIPDDVKSVLDFGCASGIFTDIFAQRYEDSVGTDTKVMLEHRQDDTKGRLVVWDGLSPVPELLQNRFDIVMAKLVFQFVDDLPALLQQLQMVLRGNGYILISVPYPDTVVHKYPNLHGKDDVLYDEKIGDTGLIIHPRYRSLQWYTDVFNDAGFELTASYIPLPNKTQQERYNISEDKMSRPSRLNLLFKKV